VASMHETSAPRQSHFLKTETILADFQPVAFGSSRNSFWEYGTVYLSLFEAKKGGCT